MSLVENLPPTINSNYIFNKSSKPCYFESLGLGNDEFSIKNTVIHTVINSTQLCDNQGGLPTKFNLLDNECRYAVFQLLQSEKVSANLALQYLEGDQGWKGVKTTRQDIHGTLLILGINENLCSINRALKVAIPNTPCQRKLVIDKHELATVAMDALRKIRDPHWKATSILNRQFKLVKGERPKRNYLEESLAIAERPKQR